MSLLIIKDKTYIFNIYYIKIIWFESDYDTIPRFLPLNSLQNEDEGVVDTRV